MAPDPPHVMEATGGLPFEDTSIKLRSNEEKEWVAKRRVVARGASSNSRSLLRLFAPWPFSRRAPVDMRIGYTGFQL